MVKLTIEFFTLDSILKVYDQYGMDEIYKLAEQTINEGGQVEVNMEYTNSEPDVLCVLSTLDEAKKFFKQV
jgi:NAD(P)H-flavin reductase